MASSPSIGTWWIRWGCRSRCMASEALRSTHPSADLEHTLLTDSRAKRGEAASLREGPNWGQHLPLARRLEHRQLGADSGRSPSRPPPTTPHSKPIGAIDGQVCVNDAGGRELTGADGVRLYQEERGMRGRSQFRRRCGWVSDGRILVHQFGGAKWVETPGRYCGRVLTESVCHCPADGTWRRSVGVRVQ
jgi:hypothetical protein